MDDSRTSLDPQVLARLKGLDLKARMIVEGYVSGLHKSPFHGFSVEFAEHREYVPGDDLRYVDWKVYGKSDRYYLKRFEEETNFVCHLLVDTSESMNYKSENAAASKLEYARWIAATLTYLILQQQDAVGVATFDSKISQFLRASSQASHFKQITQLLEQQLAQGESSMGPLFHDLAERLKKRGLVIIISDFFDDLETLRAGLQHFRYRKHDVSLLQVIDPAEQDFPFQDPTLFKGLEGLPDELADPRSLKKAYQKEFEEFLQGVKTMLRSLQMQHHLVRTDQPLDVPLSAFLTSRMHRTNRL